MKGEDRLFGMKSFSIQAPETRGFLNEWYFHKLMKKEGLIALRYGFISLQENGKSKGIYAIEESFDKQLIEFNERREAPILKFDESILIDGSIINENGTYSQENLYLMSKVDVFKGKRTLKTPYLYDQYQKGKYLLESLRSKEITLSEAMDVDKSAKLFAIADITGGHHGLRWKNVRFYFNPVVGKLELIGFDSNSGHLHSDIYYNRWINNRLGEFDVKLWKDVFFEDPLFVNRYFYYLKKYSAPEYLASFHKEIEGEKELYLSYLYSENSMYQFFIQHYEMNAKMIREKVEEYETSLIIEPHKYYLTAKSETPFLIGDQELHLSFKNQSSASCKILGLFDSLETKLNTNESFILKGRKLNHTYNSDQVTFNLIAPLDTNRVKVKRKDNLWVHKQMKVGYQFENQEDTLYVKIEHYYNPEIYFSENASLHKFIQMDEAHKTARILKGSYELTEDLILPYKYNLVCDGGVQINLNNNAVIAVNGPVNFNGTSLEPISITSSDSSGSFLVYQSTSESILNHVNFEGLSEKHSGRWHHTGAINFYEANVVLNYCKFNNNKSEDALNIVRSKFEINNCSFENVKSDAFDGDFCTGSVNNTTFNIIGNDALDFSGSQIILSGITINSVGDKAISAGEMSKIIGSKIKISNAELGLVSKDLSFLKLDNIDLLNVRLGYTVFRKKAIFGPAKIELSNYKTAGIEVEYYVETASESTVNGKTILSNKDDVTSLLYGIEFGKSSK